jgi:hypothetical protein
MATAGYRYENGVRQLVLLLVGEKETSREHLKKYTESMFKKRPRNTSRIERLIEELDLTGDPKEIGDQ